jgi:AcrR family transcriptional regulator
LSGAPTLEGGIGRDERAGLFKLGNGGGWSVGAHLWAGPGSGTHRRHHRLDNLRCGGADRGGGSGILDNGPGRRGNQRLAPDRWGATPTFFAADYSLLEALRLFARDGYEAVSVRDIAGKLGMTQSALYKHYVNKRAIFDSIVERMREDDFERAKHFDVPAESFSQMAEAYRNTEIDKVKSFSMAQFLYWTKDEFTSDFRKMLILEQYHSPEMSALYQQYLGESVLGYVEDLFREMFALNGHEKPNPRLLALEFFAPIYMMMNLYDGMEKKEEAVAVVQEHIDWFMNTMK